MYFPESESAGRVTVSPNKFVTGERARVELIFTVGADGLVAGGRLRFGLPNTGWERRISKKISKHVTFIRPCHHTSPGLSGTL